MGMSQPEVATRMIGLDTSRTFWNLPECSGGYFYLMIGKCDVCILVDGEYPGI
jgi:hypothetical protein